MSRREMFIDQLKDRIEALEAAIRDAIAVIEDEHLYEGSLDAEEALLARLWVVLNDGRDDGADR